jgi:hypothetical protein
MEQIKKKHAAIDTHVQNIDQVTNAFVGWNFFKAFEKNVNFNSFELCFKESVSWLYMLFFEAADLNLKFATAKIKDFAIPVNNNGLEVIKLIQGLRTTQQHLMDIEKPDDNDKISYCIEWYKQCVSREKPQDEKEWEKCLHELLDMATGLLGAIFICVAGFASNEFSDIIKESWDRLINRSYSKHDWELVLIKVLEDYGMSHYNTLYIASKELDKWREKLKILKDGFDFSKEARRIIEYYLQTHDLWPATGQDLIDLGVKPGKGLGEMIIKAKSLYYEEPCSKEELLKRFKKKYMTED